MPTAASNGRVSGQRWRRILAPLLVAVAAVSLAVAGLAFYAAQNLFDPDRFADRAAHALGDQDVSAAVSERIADGVVSADPDLIGARPVVEGAANGIVTSPPFQQLFRGAVADLHRTVFEEERDTVALKIADVGVLVIEALRSVAPNLARAIPDDVEPRLLAISGGSEGMLTGAAQVVDDVRWTELASLIVTFLAAGAALAVSTDRRRTARWLALSAAGVGIAGVVAFELGRALLGGRFADADDAAAARAIWDAFLADLRTWSIVLAALGLVVAAAAAALLRPLDARAWLARGWETVTTTPSTPPRRAARALALVAVGAVILIAPALATRLAVLAAGIFALYVGVAELLRLSLPEEPRAQKAKRVPRPAWRWRRPVTVVAVAALAMATVVGLAVAGNDVESAPLEIRACNGSPELCDRTVDQVVFPSTHNSFSAADQPNWLFAQHERGIPAQLEAGVRGLLIDTHYGVSTERGVYTVLERESTSREKIEEPLGRRFVETAEQLRSRIGYSGGGEQEVFLCHGFCETGATPAARGLGWIRDFLVRNPYEVVVVSVESDIGLESNAAAFRESGLLDMVWTEPLGSDRFPTLREMIEADRRVIVLVWQRGPLEEASFADFPWMHRQFGLVQETPYEFATPQRLTSRQGCRPNGGREDNPLFLLNHWVDTSPVFLPSNAHEVNDYDVLIRRARMCARIRDRLPNLVAVDFYEEGDLFRVARELNGL